jgi:phospholipid/cholesterol/gamma-HCH transport system substrate-binding protein
MGYTGRIIVELQVSQAFPLPKNSTAKIISTDLMGTKAVGLSIGDSQDLLVDGDTLNSSIESTLQEQMEQTLGPLRNKAEELLTSIDDILSNLELILSSETSSNIKMSLSHLKQSLKNVESVTGNLDTLISHEKGSIERILSNTESISNNLKNNNETITAIINNFHQISDSLAAANIASTIDNANKSLADFSQNCLKGVNRGEGSLGLLTTNDTLYLELEKSARDLNLLLEDIKANPGKYVKFSLF